MSRDYGAEIDALKERLDQMWHLIVQGQGQSRSAAMGSGSAGLLQVEAGSIAAPELPGHEGAVYFSGHYRGGQQNYRWEPQERSLQTLLSIHCDKAAKVLSALGHKQRLEILIEVLQSPMTGPEIVEKLNMGTTGQLYHHLKALLGADLIRQEERGGRYVVSGERILPLLLLGAASDLLETSHYIDRPKSETIRRLTSETAD